MLSKIVIKNFKSIEECELELKPLTILTGRNASGKSNIIEAIALLAQAVRSTPKTLKAVVSRRDFFYYDSVNSIIFKQDPSKTLSFEIHIKPSDNLKSEIGKIASKIMVEDRIERKAITSVGYLFSIRDDHEFHQSIFVNYNKQIEVKLVTNENKEITYPGGYENSQPKGDLTSLFNPSAFSFISGPRAAGEYSPEIDIGDYTKLAKNIIDELERFLGKLYVSSTRRGSIEFRSTDYPAEWTGMDGKDVVVILSQCFARRRYDSKAQKIKKWANEFGLKGIKAGFWGKQQLGSDYIDPELEIPLTIDLASFGSSQILTIITQLFWSDPGSIILIEEPEMSLHPEAQVRLQELFADAIKEGRQIICSTHSPFTILALSKIIKNKSLTVDDVAIYEVKKGKRGTKAKKLKLNNNGFIEGGLPSFMSVELDLFKDWSESLESNSEEK